MTRDPMGAAAAARRSYGDFEVTVEITSSQVNGQFPKRALAHVLEWTTLHQQELLDVWALARASRALPKIDPLE